MRKIIIQKRNMLIGIFLSIFYFLRVILLDADVKYYCLAEVQPIDELYYNELAVKIYKYGLNKIIDGTWSSTSVANAKTFFLPNIITGLSMKLLGNNYWGLKLPYVLMGFCAVVLLYLCAKILLPGFKLAHLIVVLAYIVDFNIFMLSREAVTVMPCMLACIITVYGALKITDVKLRWLFLGAWPIISFCLVYMGLPFLIIATGILFIAELLCEKKYRWKKLFFYVLGIGLGTCISEAVSIVFFQQHIVKTIADTLAAHSAKVEGLSVIVSVIKLINNGLAYWLSNAFRYNYLALVLGIVSLAALSFGAFLKKDKYAFILCVYVYIHWMQTVFLNNMTHSKATISYPIILLCIAYSICIYYPELSKRNVKRIFLPIFLCIILGSLVLIYYANTFYPKYYMYYASDSFTKYGVEMIGFVSAFCLLISIFTQKKNVIYVSGILSGIFLFVLSINYVLLNPTFTDKTLMQDLGMETNNGMVISGVGFNLYNMCEAPANSYDNYKGMEYNGDTMWQSIVNACYEYDELYFIGGANFVQKANERLIETPYNFEVEKVYSRVYRYSEKEDYPDQILYKKHIREK